MKTSQTTPRYGVSSMRRLLLALFLGVAAHAPTVRDAQAGSYLYQPAYKIDDVLREPAEPYIPQPGDIFLSTDKLFWAQAGHRLALSGPPHHSGIFVARCDGSMAILEAGPFNTIRVRLIDLSEGLEGHEERGEKAYIRRRRTPLTPEQSAQLTAWAEAQEGKRFAWPRLLRQLTLFRTRGPLRTYYVGQPNGERDSYFCSELVMETLVQLQLVDPDDARPSATYPRELFFDTSPNPFLKKHFNLSEGWYPPARWTSCPGE
jgi:hypothetical protein